MNLDPVRRVADAVLYDGFLLYPYRRTEPGRQRRWSFGHLYPRAYAAWANNGLLSAQQTQCLVEGGDGARIEVCLRFLQPVERQAARLDATAPGGYVTVPRIEVDGRVYETWREALEREVAVPSMRLAELTTARIVQRFDHAAATTTEALRDRSGGLHGVLVRRREALRGEIAVHAQRLGDDCHRLTVRAENLCAFNPVHPWDEDAAVLRSLAVVHTVVSVSGGRLVSLLDPPAPRRDAAARCVNRGCFPVLVGDRSAHDMLLAAPTILRDYPEPAEGSGAGSG